MSRAVMPLAAGEVSGDEAVARRRFGKSAFVLIIAGAVLAADQLTKWYVRHTVAYQESVPIVPSFFHITHVRNTGGAFSLFADASDSIRLPFFLLASSLALGALLYFVRQVPADRRWLLFALSGVLGGALGNLVDRVVFGRVTDFLDVHWRGYHWPAFNVADSFITVGVVILIAHSLFASDDAG
jgi:signal peptidase II